MELDLSLDKGNIPHEAQGTTPSSPSYCIISGSLDMTVNSHTILGPVLLPWPLGAVLSNQGPPVGVTAVEGLSMLLLLAFLLTIAAMQ